MDKDKPTGFYIPFHQSLLQPILACGVDRNLFYALWSIGVSIGVMMSMYWFLIVTFGGHMIVREMTKKDDMFFKIVVNHIHTRKVFW